MYHSNMRFVIDVENSKMKTKYQQYCVSTLFPSALSAFDEVLTYMTNKFIDVLIASNLFDPNTLNYTKKDYSDSLLKNLYVSQNSDIILNEAFIACPFNLNVYIEAIRLNKFSGSELETLKTLNIEHLVKNALICVIGDIDVSSESLYTDLMNNAKFISALELMGHNVVNDIQDLVFSQYSEIRGYTKSSLSYPRDIHLKTDENIKKLIFDYISAFVSTSTLKYLKDNNECLKYNDICFDEKILDEIKNYDVKEAKLKIDEYYTELIFTKLSPKLVQCREFDKELEQSERRRKTAWHIYAASVIISFVFLMLCGSNTELADNLIKWCYGFCIFITIYAITGAIVGIGYFIAHH